MGVVITNMLTMMKLMMTMMMMVSQVMMSVVHPSLVTSCVSEQLKNGVDDVKECINCFQEIQDISQGVDQAKNCTQIWLPRAAYDCHEYLELMETGDHDSSEEVLACFTDIRYSLAAEECMEDRDYTQVDEEEDVVETLTEGILCIQESQTNLTNTIRYIFTNEIEEGFEDVHQFAEDDEVDDVTELEKVEDEMISLVYHRHCNIASDNDDDEEHCNLCFNDAAHNTDLVTPQDRVRALAYCSTTYLSPTYEECSLLLEDLSNVGYS